MRQLILVCLLALVAGCAAGTTKPAAVASAATVMPSCTGTAIGEGARPDWLEVAGGHNNPNGVPYAVDQSQTVAGFIFGYPLRAGHPENPANKILWVVRFPRASSDLIISAHPSAAAGPVIKVVRPADSSPGEIYPSIVDVPTAGCWVLDLAWGSHRASLALPYS